VFSVQYSVQAEALTINLLAVKHGLSLILPPGR